MNDSPDSDPEPLPDVEYLIYDDGTWITVVSTASVDYVRQAIGIVNTSRTWREFIDRIIDFDEDLAVGTFGGTEPDDIACYLEGMDAELDDPWSGTDDLPHGTDKPWPPFDGFDPGDYPCVPTDLWELYDYTENVYGESLHELPSNRLGALLEGLDRLHCTYQMVDSIEVAWQTDGMRVSQ